MGAPNNDGTVFLRETLTISDGSTQTFDQPNFTGDTEAQNADLALRVTNITAQLAIVPTPVQLYQAHQAVINAGLQNEVNAAVAGASAEIQNLWYANQWIDRDDPDLISLGTAIGLTSDQLDDLFRAAAVL
jgi:hypothetical protein